MSFFEFYIPPSSDPPSIDTSDLGSPNDINININIQEPNSNRLDADRAAGYTLEWESIESMERWLEGEESRKMVEFVLKEKRKAA
ncbi:hypothetical protein AAF712_016914, partial [Marasmius tenuissimus]